MMEAYNRGLRRKPYAETYKAHYNEWAAEFHEKHGRDPSLDESKKFTDSYYDYMCDRADYLRKKARGE